MDTNGLIDIIRRRLALPPEDFEQIAANPKYQRLFANALKASSYQLIAEVVQSEGCHSGHVVGQRLVFDSSGNLLTRESPERICAFLMPNLTTLINAFFENLMNGRDPNEVMFNRTGCFDVGPACGGWGHVVVEMRAEIRPSSRPLEPVRK
ncbi:putative integron gene cassette protein [uncultured Desulfatiglans sp.]|uniref:Putative integron gene cassette protein n=1 Tax=Uncultured Desulfatiglans sp. TaxID=1748965 RepID=A0A653AIV7_UNCDX|nr:putative integron gene cassette protein [uncultured Desulfatiglans sp.]